MNLEFHPLTASDLNHAETHYNQKQPGLGDEFRSEVYAAIDRILRIHASTISWNETFGVA